MTKKTNMNIVTKRRKKRSPITFFFPKAGRSIGRWGRGKAHKKGEGGTRLNDDTGKE